MSWVLLGDLLQESENEDGEEEEHSGDSTSNKLLVAEDQTNYFKCFKIVGLLGNEWVWISSTWEENGFPKQESSGSLLV